MEIRFLYHKGYNNIVINPIMDGCMYMRIDVSSSNETIFEEYFIVNSLLVA